MTAEGGFAARRKPCPRCGPDFEILKPEQVAEIAAGIPVAPDLKADDQVIASRLACCAACGALREDVLCAYCGCFVLFRARPKESCCPHPEGNKWLPQNLSRHAERT
jgi:hypothetical protein